MSNVKDFFHLVSDSIDDNVSKSRAENYIVAAIVVLVLWVLLSAFGMQRAFLRISQIPKMMSAVGQGKEAFAMLQKEYELPQEAEGWSFFSSKPKEPKMSPFAQSAIANSVTILAVVLFLGIVALLQGHKNPFAGSVVTTAICCVPLTVGMLIGNGCFAWAESLQSGDMPNYLYMLGALALATAILTSILALHADIAAFLGMQKRKRYITSIATVYLAAGVFIWITRWLVTN